MDAEICMETAVRTTLNLNDELVAEAKATAVREHSTLTRLIEEGLALRLRKLSEDGERRPLKLHVFHGHGGLTPQAGDGLTNRALWDAADGEGVA